MSAWVLLFKLSVWDLYTFLYAYFQKILIKHLKWKIGKERVNSWLGPPQKRINLSPEAWGLHCGGQLCWWQQHSVVPRRTSRQWKKEILWSLHPWIVLNSAQLFLNKGTVWNWSLLPWDWSSCPLLPKSGGSLAPMMKVNSQAAVDRKAFCDFQVCEEAGRAGALALPQPYSDLGVLSSTAPPHWP